MSPSTRAVALITDSSAQLSPQLAERFATSHGPVASVPVVVTVDGADHAEGVDLDADDFYALLDAGAGGVTTAQPSPAAFVEAFETAHANGADEVLAVLVGAELSGTLDAARLAVRHAPLHVRLVDTGTASFGISCCVWIASLVLARGGTVDAAAIAAERMAADVQSVFVLNGVELARRSGRFDAEALAGAESDGLPVLRSAPGVLEVIDTVETAEQAVTAMVEAITVNAGANESEPIVVASGRAAAGSWPLTDALEAQLASHPSVKELVHYRVGPSIAAHTGPGTAGAFWFPARLLDEAAAPSA